MFLISLTPKLNVPQDVPFSSVMKFVSRHLVRQLRQAIDLFQGIHKEERQKHVDTGTSFRTHDTDVRAVEK